MSDILIKGMEMPVTCCHCPLMGFDPDREWFDSTRTGAHICVLTGELIDNTKREEHCPIIPVPPHGRLIDADALEKHIKKDWEEYDHWIAVEVENRPTVLEAEEGET